MIFYAKDDVCQEIAAPFGGDNSLKTATTLLWSWMGDWPEVRGMYAIDEKIYIQVLDINRFKWDFRHYKHPMLRWMRSRIDLEVGKVVIENEYSMTSSVFFAVDDSCRPAMDCFDFSFGGFAIEFEKVARIPSEREKKYLSDISFGDEDLGVEI